MKPTARTLTILAGIAVFVGLPLTLYAMGETPRRSLLKEGISILTLLAFTFMLGQFFLARSNKVLLSVFKPPQVQSVHKYIAYSAVAVIFLHPALIVLPRYLEGGVDPWDAFVTMVTTLDSLGIVLGLLAWVVMVVLAVTAYFRKSLIKRFATRYRGWRYFHGSLALGFTALALWHAIELGRHTDIATSSFLVALAIAGFFLLLRLYRGERSGGAARRVAQPVTQGAAT